MPRDFNRGRRLEEQILRLLSELVRREVKDPRVGLVTFTAVEISRDLSHAKVFFLPFDGKRSADDVAKALFSAAGFLRSHLKKLLQIRHVPELHFAVDHTIDEAARLTGIIHAAVADDARRAQEHPPEDAPSAASEDAAE